MSKARITIPKHARADFWPGATVNLLGPQVADIDLQFMARRLARIPRFLGGTSEPYTVAQHSLRVCDRVPRAAKPYALLHDAHEAWIGDITAPVSAALSLLVAQASTPRKAVSFLSALESLRTRWDAAIFNAAGLPPPSHAIIATVEHADAEACQEELNLLVRGERHSLLMIEDARTAERNFIEALGVYCPETQPIVAQWREWNSRS